MSARPRDRLLVSSVNGGGLFHLDEDGVERLSSIDTAGIARCRAGVWLFARQDELSNELRRYAGDEWSSCEVAPHVLDLHDVLFDDESVYVVATEINAVLQLDPAELRETQRWRLEGESDSSHVNSLCIHQGRLLASRFGHFPGHRGYKGRTAGAGEVYDVRTGEVVIAGLSQPHSLSPRGDELWLCDSEARSLRCYRGFVEVRSVQLDGYVRGLAFGEDGIHVGLSRSRNASSAAISGATVLTLDPDSLCERRRTPLPVDEIYDIRVFDGDLAQLRRAGLMETQTEVSRQRQARKRSEASAIEAHNAARGLADALHQANLRVAGYEAIDDGQAARVTALERTAADDAAWARLLEAEVSRLRARLEFSARALESARDWMASAVDMQADLRAVAAMRADQLETAREALRAKDAYIAQILTSRRWRMTAWLGQDAAEVPASPAPVQDSDLPQALVPPPDIAIPQDDPGASPRRAMIPITGLAFDSQPAPRVSIVVVGCTDYAGTLASLLSIQSGAGNVRFEVVAVDGSAGCDEMQRFRNVPGLRWIEGARDDCAADAAGRACVGEFIAFLHAGARARPGWLESLLATFPIFPDCGMVGPRLLSSDGLISESGVIVWSDGSCTSYGEGEAPDDPAYAVVREVDRVGGAALMVPAAALREAGGLEGAGMGWADAVADLAFRMRESGRRVYHQPAAAVVLGEASVPGPSGCGDGGREMFVERWRDVLAQEHWGRGEQVFLAKDRGQLKPTVLVVDHRAPEPDRDAGSRAIWHLLRVLHVFGFNVKFWAISEGDDPRYAIGLRMHGIELFNEQRDGPFDAWLQEHGRCIDHVVLSRPMVAWERIDAVRSHSGASVLYYGHDIHYQRLQRQYEVSGEDWLPPHVAHVRGVEEALWRACDLVLYPTEEETRHVRAWLARNAPGGRAETIPLFAYESIHSPVPGPGSRRDVMFVGSYQHAPNEDGAYWFATEVWPLVRQARNDLRLCLVGADASERLRSLAADDVVIAGSVDEATLAMHYDAARVAVAPLRFGAGLKGKVIEAMRYGVPCVTTAVGAQGLQPASFLRVADTPHAMAAQVLEAAGDDGLWRQASGEAQAYVVERFSVHSVWNILRLAMDNSAYPSVEARRRRIAANRAVAAPPMPPIDRTAEGRGAGSRAAAGTEDHDR